MNYIEEIKMLTDLFEDGYITELEMSDLIAKASKKFQAKEKEVEEPFEFIDQEFAKVEGRPLKPVPFVKLIPDDGEISNLPYTDEKDDFDMWKEKNGIDENVKHNRYVYKGDVYWVKEGSDEEHSLMKLIIADSLPSPKESVDYPSQLAVGDIYSGSILGGYKVFAGKQPRVTSPLRMFNNSLSLADSTVKDEMNAITIESLKGTIVESEHNE